MNFDQYKDRLIDYLSLKGINAHLGLIRCFSPSHDDKNPSCELFNDHFSCYSGRCGIHGDIYDAVEILEGITDKKEQLKHLEIIFGSNQISITPKQEKDEKTTFIADPKALDTIENYLKKNKAAEKVFKVFWDQRAIFSTNGKIKAYPIDYSRLNEYLLYWPGMDIARKEIDPKILRAAGIPLTNPNTGKCSWEHSGVVIRLGHGFKLHFFQNKICEKRGTKCCSTFPTPGIPDLEKPVILVEGEIDAIVCKAAGIENVFSAGGTNGLTGPKIQASLLKAKEIIILFDNDEAGLKTSGIIPFSDNDKRKISLPEIFIKAGYKGAIKIAQLKGAYKDPDEAILNGALNLVTEAIKTAKPFVKETEEITDHKSYLSNKELKTLLKRLAKSDLEQSEIEKFIGACCAAVPTCTAETFAILKAWGATDLQLKNPHPQHPQFLLTIARKYNLSYYYTSKLERAFISKKNLEKLASGSMPIIDINFEKLDEDNSLKNFTYKKGGKTAATILAKLLQNKFIYVEADNKYYTFNGHIWKREPDPCGIVYNILLAIINHRIKKTPTDAVDQLESLKKTLTKIEERKFRSDIVKDLAVAPGIFHDQVLFDSPKIRETLTLQDGVMDFSGRKIIYTKSKQDEYRKETLPYTVDDIMNAKEPKKFLKFMSDNFKNADTLETFMYYLSLIPSRCTQYKYGGIFIGRPHTGKTTTIELIMRIYEGMIVRLPSESLVSTGKRGYTATGPNPYIARLEGKGAAVAQETERNGYLNGALWKELTGGDTLTARGMYSQPRDFTPTAQIIMASNHTPRFDNKDQATIDRMVVIPFQVEHKHGDKETKEQTDIMKDLVDEYPAVVKLLAEYYIRFKHIHHGKLPLSEECAMYKDDYIQQQETDLDHFVEDNIDFEKNEEVWETIKNVYTRYLSYYSYATDINGKPTDKEAWSQSKFTRIMKHDYPEIRTKQKKINGYPEQIFQYLKLKPDEGQKGERPLDESNLNSKTFTEETEEEAPFGQQ